MMSQVSVRLLVYMCEHICPSSFFSLCMSKTTLTRKHAKLFSKRIFALKFSWGEGFSVPVPAKQVLPYHAAPTLRISWNFPRTNTLTHSHRERDFISLYTHDPIYTSTYHILSHAPLCSSETFHTPPQVTFSSCAHNTVYF